MDVPLEQLDDMARTLHVHLRSALQQRDAGVLRATELSQSCAELERANQMLQLRQQQLVATAAGAAGSGAATEQKQQNTALELAEIKSRMRKLRQEL